MKSIIKLILVTIILSITSSSCEKQNNLNEKNVSQNVNEYIFQKEVVVNDNNNNSVFLRVKSNEKNNLNNFLRNVNFVLNTSEKKIEKRNYPKKNLAQTFNKEGLSKYSEAIDPGVTIEIVTTNLQDKVESYSVDLNTIKNRNKSWVMDYSSALSVENGGDKFVGAVHKGHGNKFLAQYYYKKHWYSLSWKRLSINGVNSWWIYPNIYPQHYTAWDENTSWHKKRLVVYPDLHDQYWPNNVRIVSNANKMYGQECSIGSYDSSNCYVGSAPNGTNAFIYNNNFYYTPINGNECPYPGSHYDGANCFVMNIPDNCEPFIYDNNWYVRPDLIDL